MAHHSDIISAAIEELKAVKERCNRLERQTKELQTSLDSANAEISRLNERFLESEDRSREKDQEIQKLSNQIFIANSNLETMVDAVMLFCTDPDEEDNGNSINNLESFVLVDENQVLHNEQGNDQKVKEQEVFFDDHKVFNTLKYIYSSESRIFVTFLYQLIFFFKGFNERRFYLFAY